MTDGTTAFQVGPITEEDMGKVHDILRRAVDAIVGMSQLSKDVENMRADMAQMSDELERLRRTNNALEESLDSSRRHRQELEQKVHELQSQTNRLEDERLSARRDADHYMQSTNGLLDQIAQVKRERDDAQYRALELEEKLSKSDAKLSVIRDLFGGAPTPAVPEPTPEPPKPIAHTERVWLDHYEAGAMWDTDRQSYYRDEQVIPF